MMMMLMMMMSHSYVLCPLSPELVFPWCTFVPHRSAWIFNGCWQVIFQAVLISTGNLRLVVM